ncbi:MAG: nitroreductase family protein [Spirochaetota bacterium]|nr:MAG: nitroreductase family protein [Spirochaetota bacterium]
MKALNPVEFIKGLYGIIDGKVHLPESQKENPVLQVLLRRRSVRKFKKEDIPEDVFRVILEAARVAPCAINLQSWVLGIYNQDTWKKTFGRSIPFDAPRAVMVMGDIHRTRGVINEISHYPLVEYTLAVMNASIAAYAMNIAAESCGVASVMLSETGKSGFYDAKYLKKKLNLPDGVFPILTIVFGFPKGKPLAMPPKLPIEEITFSEKYKETDRDTMKEWLNQMIAGYRAWRITDSFQNQVKRYVERAGAAEENLNRLVFYNPEE